MPGDRAQRIEEVQGSQFEPTVRVFGGGRSTRWVALLVFLGSVVLSVLIRSHPVTGALILLAGVGLVAQAYGTAAGLTVTVLANGLIGLYILPYSPEIDIRYAATSFFVVSSVFCLLQAQLPVALRGETRARTLTRFCRDLNRAGAEEEVKEVLETFLQSQFGEHYTLWLDSGPGVKDDYRFPYRLSPEDTAVSVALPRRPEEERLLEAFLLYAGQTVQQIRMMEKVRESEILKATEKLHRSLLNSVSHDLRIPLVSITGVLTGLAEGELELCTQESKELVDNALAEAKRLNRLVANLLQMTELEAGVKSVARKLYDPWDVVIAVLESFNAQIGDREVELEAPDDLPMVVCEPSLIGLVMSNLLDNALKYSRANLPVRIEASFDSEKVTIEVLDRGSGMDEDERKHAFEKFFRGREASGEGSGLGLSICEGVVSAHGGRCWLEPRDGGGSKAGFFLPRAVLSPEVR